MSFKIAKIIVVLTIVEFCKGGAQIRGAGGREIDPLGLCTQG